MRELIEAESKNFEANAKRLDDSIDLIHDFERVYEALTPCLTSPPSEPDKTARAAAVYLLAFCRRQITMSSVILLRGYRADSLLHLRRAIESCAFAVRICKHPDLAAVWGGAGSDEEAYRKYRVAFRTGDVFPNPKHADHLPELAALKERYDLCSRLMHGGVSGLAGHFQTTPESFRMVFFDLPPDHSLFSTLLLLLDAHLKIATLFGQVLESHTNDRLAAWMVRLNSVEAKLVVHAQRWAPMIKEGITLRAALSKPRMTVTGEEA